MMQKLLAMPLMEMADDRNATRRMGAKAPKLAEIWFIRRDLAEEFCRFLENIGESGQESSLVGTPLNWNSGDNMEKVLVLGAGGHAKVVIATARASAVHVAGILDDDSGKIGQEIFGVEVVGTFADLYCFRGEHCIIAIGDNEARQRAFEKWRWRQIHWGTLVHPSAFIDGSAQLEAGTVVFAGATVQVDVSIGAHCIINTQASIDHDCQIGDFAHIAPGCHLAGNVTVRDGAFLGIGSSIIPGVTIGRNAVVGAGAVVLSDVPDDTTVVGVPARVIGRRG